MAMDSILATIANGRQAIVDIDREAGRNKFTSCLFNYFILSPSMMALADPFCRGSQGWGMFLHKNHAAWEGNGSIMEEMFVCCFVLTAKKPVVSQLYPVLYKGTLGMPD